MNDSRMDTMSMRSRGGGAYDDLKSCNSSTYISPQRRRGDSKFSSRMSNGTQIRSSRGSVKSGYSNYSSGSVILKVISGARSNGSYQQSMGSTYSKSSTILKKGGRRQAPKSRRDNQSVRSGRSNF